MSSHSHDLTEAQMRATYSEAVLERMVWKVPDFESVVGAIKKLGAGPDQLTELSERRVDGPCVLAIVRPGPRFDAGDWFARKSDQVFIVVVVVDESRYAALQGTSPQNW